MKDTKPLTFCVRSTSLYIYIYILQKKNPFFQLPVFFRAIRPYRTEQIFTLEMIIGKTKQFLNSMFGKKKKLLSESTEGEYAAPTKVDTL